MLACLWRSSWEFGSLDRRSLVRRSLNIFMIVVGSTVVGPLSVVASTVDRTILPLALLPLVLLPLSYCCRSHYIRSHYILSLYTADASLYNQPPIALPSNAHALFTRDRRSLVPLSLVARSTFVHAHCHRCTR